MPFIESFNEFKQRMGCDVLDVTGERFQSPRHLFENGATSDGRTSHSEPPEDQPTLLSLKREYLAEKLNRLKKRYESLRADVGLQSTWFASGSGPHPDSQFPDWKKTLKAWGKEIAALKEQVAAIDAAKEKAKPDSFAMYQQKRMEAQQEAKQTLAALNQFTTYDPDGGMLDD